MDNIDKNPFFQNTNIDKNPFFENPNNGLVSNKSPVFTTPVKTEFVVDGDLTKTLKVPIGAKYEPIVPKFI